MKYLVLDIETYGDEKLANAVDYLNPNNAPVPSNYKKEEAIEKFKLDWIGKEKNKLALNSKFAGIQLVTMVTEDSFTVLENPEHNINKEQEIIEAVYDAIMDVIHSGDHLVTFNGKRFDIPLIMERGQIVGAQKYLLSLETLLVRGTRFKHIDLSEMHDGNLDMNLRVRFGFGKRNTDPSFFAKASYDEIKRYAVDEAFKLEYWYRTIVGLDTRTHPEAKNLDVDDVVSLHNQHKKQLVA